MGAVKFDGKAIKTIVDFLSEIEGVSLYRFKEIVVFEDETICFSYIGREVDEGEKMKELYRLDYLEEQGIVSLFKSDMYGVA